MKQGKRFMERIRVAVLGPLTIFREALQQALAKSGFDVLFAGSPTDLRPDPRIHVSLLVADDWDGDIVTALHRTNPESRIVVVNSVFDYQKLRLAFQLEVAGFLLRELSLERLVSSLRLVALGETVFPSQLGEALRKQAASTDSVKAHPSASASQLSRREMDIVRCLIAGYPNKMISRRLSISEATVKVHLKSILRKLNLANRTQVALWAVEAGIAGNMLDGCAENI
jgi:two-component system nitrate/nitrite response regulator NarL